MFTFAFCVLLYFLPSIVAHDKRSFTGILILNLLLGWTVIGWFVALIWACTDEPRVPVLVVHGPSPAMAMGPATCFCCRCGAPNPAGANFCRACGQRI
jgi:hypothetical protein